MIGQKRKDGFQGPSFKRQRSAPQVARVSKFSQHFFDTTVAATTVAAAGTVLSPSLCLMQVGTAENSRVGNRVKITSIHVRGEITLPPSAVAAVTEQVRIMVVLDRQSNGAAPTIVQILASADFRSFNNMDNKGRFQTLAEEVVQMNYQTGVNATPAWAAFGAVLNMNKKGLGIGIQYGASTGAVTDLRTNNIAIVAISSAGAATVGYIARVRYEDL